jgi:Holliday junction resolvase RusA-like endonuclease
MITLPVDALPPTVNHLYRNRRGGGRCLSAAAEAWYDYAIPTLRLQARPAVPRGPLRLRINVHGLPRTTDVDNVLKAAIDALRRALEFDDRWIDDLRIVRIPVRRGGVRFTVYELEALAKN